MDNGFQKARGKDTAAVQFMVFDILENLVNLSKNPGHLGTYLAQQVRELVGARLVALLRPTSEGPGHHHALLAIEPQRHGTPAIFDVLNKLAHFAHEEEGPVLWQGASTPEPVQALLGAAGFNGAMVLPLRVGNRTVGMLVIVHLLDMQRNTETLRALEILAPVAALVIQNAIFFESQETVILARTQDLRDSERHFHTLAQVAPVGILHMGIQGEVLFVNERWKQLTGCVEPPVGHPAPMRVHPDDQAEVVRKWAELRRTGSSFQAEFRIETPRSELCWVLGEMVAERNENGAITGFIGSLLDITPRRQTEEALRVSEERYALAERAVADGIWDWNLATHESYLSPRWKEILGYEDHELKNHDSTFFQLLHPDDREQVQKALQAHLDHHARYNFELRLRHKDGTFRWLLNRGEGLRDATGRGYRMVGSISDITERKHLEDERAKLQTQLSQSQKMESLGTLAGGVAHDMNNVLGAILGLASANVDTQPPGSPIQRALETIINAAERGGKMVKSLLSFARQSPAEMRVVNLNDILQEEVRMLERTTLAKVRLVMDLATGLRPIQGDANALTHAFMNLSVNAVDAMPENGVLTLRTRNVDQAWVEVIVEDNGSGMTAEVMAKALDPFFTTKEVGKGTGLGLSMVYSTVKSHQGQMDIQSNLGQGTRVRMRFPACEAQVSHPELATAPKAGPAPGALHILLVDDDDLIQSSMLAILEVLGHRAVGVSSGEEALAKLEAGLQPNVVILDMNMPGLGGAGTLPRLRALNPTVPVLLATGRVDQFALELAAAHPFVTLLSKPFSMKDLQQRLAEHGND